MERAVCYIRVSTQEQATTGVSLDSQEERLLAYCTMQGLEGVTVVREEGVSGSKALGSRPGGAEVLRMVARRQVKHVVALKLDRLFRNAADALAQTEAWDKAGVGLHLVDMGGQSLNTSSAMGRMMLTMMAGFAEFERALIAERTASALAHKKAHRQAYAPTPFGFDRDGSDLIPNDDEQDALGTMRRWRATGVSLRDIAGRLTEAGIPTKQGGAWHAGTVRYMLANAG